jgi:hypothetical protein
MQLNILNIAIAVGSIWLVLLSFFLIRLLLHYQNLVSGAKKKDLITCLNRLISQNKLNEDSIEKLSEALKKEKRDNRNHLQCLGFKRFNPFTDTGGNQSFALSLLDENGNGIVVSSLHSRENTRVYAKSVRDGKPTDQTLSKEESEVINQALKL